MGYSTNFGGEITIDPPIDSLKKFRELTKFLDADHSDNDAAPSTYCDLELSEDGGSIAWDGAEKTRSLPEWFVYLIKHQFEGHVLNGMLDAEGEDQGDIWFLNVENNVVSTEDVDIVPNGKKNYIT